MSPTVTPMTHGAHHSWCEKALKVYKSPAWLLESTILVSHVVEALSQTREDDLPVCKVILAQTPFFSPLLLAFVFTFLATEVLCQKLKEAVLVVD